MSLAESTSYTPAPLNSQDKASEKQDYSDLGDCDATNPSHYENVNTIRAGQSELPGLPQTKSKQTNHDAFVFGNIFIERYQLARCIKFLSEIMDTCDLKVETGIQDLSDREIERKIQLCTQILNSFNLHFYENCEVVEEVVEEVFLVCSSKAGTTEEPLYCDMSRLLKALADSDIKVEKMLDKRDLPQRETNTSMDVNYEAMASNDSRFISDMTPGAPSSHEYESISSSYIKKMDERDLANDLKQGLALPDETHDFKTSTDELVQKMFLRNMESQCTCNTKFDETFHLEKENLHTKIANWFKTFDNDKVELDDKTSESENEEFHTKSGFDSHQNRSEAGKPNYKASKALPFKITSV